MNVKDIVNNYYKQLQQAKAENERLRKALEEIREIAKCRVENMFLIDKINKVIGEQ